jgi:hypothetical protein
MAARQDSAQVPSPSPAASLPPAHYPGPGFRIGGYTITETLGHGAMATVYAAEDGSGNEVAIKIFQEGPGVSTTMLERFRREAEASKKLRRHPNIITVYATGQEGPYHFIVMESVRNSQTLETALENTPMGLKATVELVIKIARALQYAHSRNIVHRDVKPSNIMVDEFGEPLLSDFGVAALIDWPTCTITGALTGTPLYMSPEQARAERVGASSDVYSMGVVLFEAVTGVLPYSTQHASPIKEVLVAVRDELPRRPRLYRKEISPELEAVMLKALEKNPKDRYIDAEAFAVDLERALAGRPVSAHHFTYIEQLRHLARKHQRPLTTLLLVFSAAAAVGLYFRARLMSAHYENLLALAWRRNAQHVLAQSQSPATPEGLLPAAWQDIRLARMSMNSGEWEAAAAGLRSATARSRLVEDARLAAIAQLDLARCQLMLGDRPTAIRTYLEILHNPEAPPALAGLAQLEYLGLTLLTGDRDAAFKALLLREPPAEGPLREAMNCLAGTTPIERLIDQVDNYPNRFRNDVFLAAAIRAFLNGDNRASEQYLRRSAMSSIPSSEWPGPFARLLRNEQTR